MQQKGRYQFRFTFFWFSRGSVIQIDEVTKSDPGQQIVVVDDSDVINADTVRQILVVNASDVNKSEAGQKILVVKASDVINDMIKNSIKIS